MPNIQTGVRLTGRPALNSKLSSEVRKCGQTRYDTLLSSASFLLPDYIKISRHVMKLNRYWFVNYVFTGLSEHYTYAYIHRVKICSHTDCNIWINLYWDLGFESRLKFGHKSASFCDCFCE
jgi:hypothetical protein